MYVPTCSSSSSSTSAILRAAAASARVRFASSLSDSFSSSVANKSFRSCSKSKSFVDFQSKKLSWSVRSLTYSVPKWSHGVAWRSPLSLRAQIRTASPVIERFQRKIATMGIYCGYSVDFCYKVWKFL